MDWWRSEREEWRKGALSMGMAISMSMGIGPRNRLLGVKMRFILSGCS